MGTEDGVLLEEGQEAPEIDARVTGGVRFSPGRATP